MPWYFPALLSAISWGIYYPLSENLLKRFSPPFLLAATHLVSCIVFSTIFTPTVARDFRSLSEVSFRDGAILLSLMFLCIFGNYVSFMAISLKNATLTAFIEVSYPIFAVLFAYLFFQQIHLSLTTLFGATLVIAGLIIISHAG